MDPSDGWVVDNLQSNCYMIDLGILLVRFRIRSQPDGLGHCDDDRGSGGRHFVALSRRTGRNS